MKTRKFVWVVTCLALVLSSSTHAAGAAQDARKFQEFGNVHCELEIALLDTFATEYQNKQTESLYIVTYAARRTQRDEAQVRAERMMYYLTNSRGIPSDKVSIVRGGYREEIATELWIAPPGACPPTPTPTVQAKEVKFLRGRTKRVSCNEGLG